MRMVSTLQDVILQKGSYVLRLPDGARVFVKVSSSTRKGPIEGLKASFDREKVCLRLLRGLAVPRLVRLPSDALPAFCQLPGMVYVAQSWEGEKIDYARLSPPQAVGTWIFVLEQLVAFRRLGILYTDVKCANVLVQRAPSRAVIVDFGAATPYVPRLHYLRECGFTHGFVPPECRGGHRPTERSLVYSAGILLPHVLTGLTSASIHDARVGLTRVRRILQTIDTTHIADVLADCLAEDPSRRPRHYEELLRRVRSCALPRTVQSVWHDLREPYRKYLRRIGLGW